MKNTLQSLVADFEKKTFGLKINLIDSFSDFFLWKMSQAPAIKIDKNK